LRGRENRGGKCGMWQTKQVSNISLLSPATKTALGQALL